MCASPEVRSWVLENLKGDVMTTPNWKGFEISGSIILDHEEWTTDNGLITPKLSVRRNRLLDRHQEDIDVLK
jgi:long-subunit acyl-CoA synthetase (AMP-forming)